MKLASKNGAKAILFVNDADASSGGDGLMDFNYTALGGRGDLPAFHIKRSVLDSLLKSVKGVGLDEVEKSINKDLEPKSAPLTGWTVSLELKSRRDKAMLKNVVGVLEGAGPLARETVIVGAHYDHLGFGSGSSRSSSKTMAIHPGADDNASGTTAILELARRFASVPKRQGRRLVFVAFSGEELGLNGSVYYCKNPLFPLNETNAMFNLDMVGRLRPDSTTGKDKLFSEGSGTAKEFKQLLEGLIGKHGFTLSPKVGGDGPSDHASFNAKKVPVLFLWTGYHEDYHRPGDTADKINVAGMRKIVDLSQEAVQYLATEPKRLAYVEIKGSPRPRPSTGMPRLGIRPEYGEEEEKGVAVGGVSPGEPAERAGIKAGDVIVGIEGKPVKNLETYMEVMSGMKKGSTIEVTVMRAGKKTPIKVKLE
jgi:hypothetical protein